MIAGSKRTVDWFALFLEHTLRDPEQSLESFVALSRRWRPETIVQQLVPITIIKNKHGNVRE
jgi:hypothetical protein